MGKVQSLSNTNYRTIDFQWIKLHFESAHWLLSRSLKGLMSRAAYSVPRTFFVINWPRIPFTRLVCSSPTRRPEPSASSVSGSSTFRPCFLSQLPDWRRAARARASGSGRLSTWFSTPSFFRWLTPSSFGGFIKPQSGKKWATFISALFDFSDNSNLK